MNYQGNFEKFVIAVKVENRVFNFSFIQNDIYLCTLVAENTGWFTALFSK